MQSAHVVGMARSGIAAAEMLLEEKWSVVLSDVSETELMKRSASELRTKGAAVFIGGHQEALRIPVDIAVVSPGIPPDAPVLQELKMLNIPIISEIELGWRHLNGTLAAVTGSNGKSTTVALLGKIFECSGRNSFTCGNIGLPLTSVVRETDDQSLIALEVSSYQLENIKSFKPDIAAILNYSLDHIEWHGSENAYKQAKMRLWENQDVNDTLVYNIDDEVVHYMITTVSTPRSQIYPFSTRLDLAEGASLFNNNMVFRLPNIEETHIPTNEMRIQGMHNVENALAACSMAFLFGIQVDTILQGLNEFRGLPHRLELISELNGVQWINDSKATNVDAGIIALKAMSNPVILLAGGRAKGGGFEKILSQVKRIVKEVVVFGEASKEIEEDLKGHVSVQQAANLETAVDIAAHDAEMNDVVLLTPLCASFDQFDNFEHRGDVFRVLVEQLQVAI